MKETHIFSAWNSVYVQWKERSHGIANSLSVFVYTKYTEFANQSKFGGGLDQTSYFLGLNEMIPKRTNCPSAVTVFDYDIRYS